MKIKEVIVVEGKADRTKVKQAVSADTIETNGSAINQYIMKQIRHAQEKRGVIIFTDPDYPGARIRHMIDEEVPGCKHAFLTKNEATEKKTQAIGIEHASIETIRRALASVYEVMEDGYKSDVTKADLISLGLIGSNKARKRRENLGEMLRIGHVNGKQLLNRLDMFQITKKHLKEAMQSIIQEEEDEI